MAHRLVRRGVQQAGRRVTSGLELDPAPGPVLGRRAIGLGLAGWVLGMGLVGCAQLLAPQRIVLSEAQLQRQLQAQFPMDRQLLDLFEVRASSPSLRLLPDQNRLAALVDINARERLLGSRVVGRLDFNAGVRWEPSDLSVRLDQVRVEDLALDGDVAAPAGSVKTTGLRRTAMERVAAALVERVLEGMTLYRVPPEKMAQLQKAGVRPSAIDITRNGLEITLQPFGK